MAFKLCSHSLCWPYLHRSAQNWIVQRSLSKSLAEVEPPRCAAVSDESKRANSMRVMSPPTTPCQAVLGQLSTKLIELPTTRNATL